MNAEGEMERVWIDAQSHNVTVNGWQEGTGNIPGFAMVTDMATRTTFGIIPGERVCDALGRAQARMAAGSLAEPESKGIPRESNTTSRPLTKGGGA